MTPESLESECTDDRGWPIWPPRDQAIGRFIRDAWNSGQWGHYHSELADHLAGLIVELMQVKEVRLCSSGTLAVELALRGVGVQSGDEVIVAGYDYPGNLRCIELLGAVPVLVDIEPNGATMSLTSLQQIHRPNVKAVILSHLYGQLADARAIRQVCDERGWSLIEDACQVPGAGWNTERGFRSVGSFSHASTLSFGGSKPLTAGSGGAVATNDDRVAAKIRGYVERPSDATSLSPLQCAALIPQISLLKLRQQKRIDHVRQLMQLNWNAIDVRLIQQDLTEVLPAYYKLALASADAERRVDLRNQLSAIGIPVGEGFRSAHRMSDRRVRKPVGLDYSAKFAEQVLLIDHRFLLSEDLARRLELLLKIGDL